jgi:hypothetical protein
MPALKIRPITGASNQPEDNDFLLELNENITTSAANPTVVGVLYGFNTTAERDSANFAPFLTGDDGGRFELVKAETAGPDGAWQVGEWIVRLKNSGPSYFNYENNVADNNFTYRSNVGGIEYEVSIDILVKDVNEGPSSITLEGSPVSSGAAGATVGTLRARDEDDEYNHESGETQQITYTIDNGENGSLFLIDGGVLKLRPGASLDYNSAPHVDGNGHYYQVIVRATDGGGWNPDTGERIPSTAASSTQVIKVYVANVVNKAPPAPSGTFAIDERSAADTVVATLAARDEDNQVITYTFQTGGTVSADGRYKIVGNQIQVNNPAEVTSNSAVSYAIVANDGSGAANATSNGNVTITVNNVNRAPTTPTIPANTSVAETTATNGLVAMLSSADPDGQAVTYTFAGGGLVSADGRFKIAGNQILVNEGSKLAVNGDEIFRYQIVASDGVGGTSQGEISIRVNNVDTIPVITISGDKEFYANDTGSTVAPFDGVTLADADSSTLTVKITFARDDGELTFLPAANATFEDDLGNRTYTIRGSKDALALILDNVIFNPRDRPTATSTSTKTTEFVLTVQDGTSTVTNRDIKVITTITDKTPGNHEPHLLTFADGTTGSSIAENTAGGVLGVLKGADQDPGDTLEFAIAQNGDPSGKFEVVETTSDVWVLKLKAGQSLDYENSGANHRHVVRIVVTDGHGGSRTQDFTINVSDVTEDVPNGIPSVPTLSNTTIQELVLNNTPVGTLSASDPDGNALTYKIVSASGALVDNDGRFQIVGNQTTGYQLQVANGVQLDYEQVKQHSVKIEVSDGRGGTARQTFAINVSDLARETMTAAHESAANDVIKASKTANSKDTLRGGLGDDKLWGGYGNDTLWGGTGKDTFVFDGKLGTSSTDRKVNFDTIKDYSVKDDSIWLDNDLFKSNKALYSAIKKGTETKPLKMASKFFTVGDKAKDADDYFVYDSKKRVLYYDADGSGSKAAIEMATFTNNKLLKNFKATELFFI